MAIRSANDTEIIVITTDGEEVGQTVPELSVALDEQQFGVPPLALQESTETTTTGESTATIDVSNYVRLVLVQKHLFDFDAEIARVSKGIPDKKTQAMIDLAARAAASAKARQDNDLDRWAKNLADSHAPSE